MSTRRARIKAVAALPPRRKNLENADTKTKQKEHFEKTVKSPRTPRSRPGKNEEKSSPVKSPIRTPPALLPIYSVSKSPASDKVPSPAPPQTSKDSYIVSNTPKLETTGVTIPTPSSSDTVPNTPICEITGVKTTPRDAVPNRCDTTGVMIPIPSDNVSYTPILETPGEITPISHPITVIHNINACSLSKNSPDRRKTASSVVHPSPKPISADPGPKTSGLKDQTFVINTLASESSQTTNKVVMSAVGTNNDNTDEYRVPSVPESITVKAILDGIVPLKASSNASRSIDLLKHDIISETAEVSFDPIIPLPSPSKVRHKLRPVPRLAPHRRNSFQGSASESEDESRRALLSGGAATPARQRHDSHTTHASHVAPQKEINRVRNDSVSSNVSQAPAHPPPATSPVKEKHFSNKARRQEMSRRSWCRRKEPKREALTMYDLIFYNPTTNPIVPDEDEVNAKEANAKEEAERKKEEAEKKKESKSKESEEDADDPPANDAAPVPQIKLGPNGEIILDEKSLVINQSEANRKLTSTVREGSWAGLGGGKYTRSARTADWSEAETIRFYRALAAVGTDFSLMAHLFPDRKRKDLYLKFKKEERHNGAQVDKALRSATAWDPEHLQQEFTKEREEAAKKAEETRRKLLQKKEEERQRIKELKELKIRCSRGSKALETTSVHGANNKELTADEFLRKAMEARPPPSKKKKTEEFVLPTAASKPPPTSPFATLTLLGTSKANTNQNQPANEMATISRIENTPPLPLAPTAKPVPLHEVSCMPSNIETGSLVILRVNDPKDPTKTMLQTYIASGTGKLTPVALPPTFLNSVVGYMKKDGSKTSSALSPQMTSPNSVTSNASDSRSCTPGVIQLNPSPNNKRQRHSSYSITPL